MTDLPIAREPFYSTTRRAGDTLYLSGFGPVDPGMNVRRPGHRRADAVHHAAHGAGP